MFHLLLKFSPCRGQDEVEWDFDTIKPKKSAPPAAKAHDDTATPSAKNERLAALQDEVRTVSFMFDMMTKNTQSILTILISFDVSLTTDLILTSL